MAKPDNSENSGKNSPGKGESKEQEFELIDLVSDDEEGQAVTTDRNIDQGMKGGIEDNEIQQEAAERPKPQAGEAKAGTSGYKSRPKPYERKNKGETIAMKSESAPSSSAAGFIAAVMQKTGNSGGSGTFLGGTTRPAQPPESISNQLEELRTLLRLLLEAIEELQHDLKNQ